mgnify:CR=1 FL=1
MRKVAGVQVVSSPSVFTARGLRVLMTTSVVRKVRTSLQRPCVPSRRLGDPVRSWTQRDILDESINRSLKAELGGGRALYDTILAGYKAVLNGYDADYTNTLTIVTDGRDDDLQGPTPATLIA